MFTKKTSSTQSDPLTNFMRMITKEFKEELEKSDNLNRTIKLINEFVLTMKTILEDDITKPN